MRKLLNALPILITIALIYNACTKQQTPTLQLQANTTANPQMKLGNPSNAGTKDRNNYLLPKPQVLMSYRKIGVKTSPF